MSFFYYTLNKYSRRCVKTSFSTQPQYLVFKELFLERHDLSKPSKTSSTVS